MLTLPTLETAVQSQGVGRAALPEEALSEVASSFSQLLGSSGIPGLPDASSSLCLVSTWPFGLCFYVPNLPLLSYKGASHQLERPLQHQHSLTWDTHLFPNKGTSTGTKTGSSLLGRHSLTYGRYGNSQRDHKLSHFNSTEPWRQKSLWEGEKIEAVMNYFWKSNQFLQLNLPASKLFLYGQKRETVWNLKQEGEDLKTCYLSLVTTVPFSIVKCLKAPFKNH